MKKYAFYKTELGYFKIAYENRTVFCLKCVNGIDDENNPSAVSDLAFLQVREYLDGNRTGFDFPYELHGTEFQMKVWKALCDIPYGETRSYRDIAEVIGNSKASRAVGMANHRNPMCIVVPCHRVIGANGKLTGYAGGLDMKKRLLELEQKCKTRLAGHAFV